MKTIMATDNFFKDEIDRMNWMGRMGTKGYTKSREDVTISVVYSKMEHKLNGTNKKIAFTFRNRSRHVITETEYVMVAVVKNRVFFKTSNASDGLLVGHQANTKDNGYVKISQPEYVERLLPFVGSYDLKYDKFYELYYVEKEDFNNEVNS